MAKHSSGAKDVVDLMDDDDDNIENDNDDDSSTMIPSGQMPSFLADAFAELYEEDGLTVMAKGLGCMLLLASFVRFYADTEQGYADVLAEEEKEEHAANHKRRNRKRPLVMVLGLRDDSERQNLAQILTSWGTAPELMPVMITNEAGQHKARQELYQQGGVFCITSRILVTDLLTHVVQANQIDGFLVAHAHDVTDESTEAFILRIYHAQKQPALSGFVKGFTDDAQGLLTGFAKVDKVLKCLRCRRLYLWPRFQDAVREELEARPPAVTELHQSLSPLQKEIQHALAAAVQSCIRELKQSTTKLEWNADADLSIENCVTTQFDRAIRRQLEPEWHKLGGATKQLVQDLRTLRTLFSGLIQYDCVSFWRLLNNIKTMAGQTRTPSLWLLTPAADRLFRKAKERVYRIEHGTTTTAVENTTKSGKTKKKKNNNNKTKAAETTALPTGGAHLVTVLEENPKWKLVRKVLQEIQQDYQQQEEQNDKDNIDIGPTTALVMVKDDRTLDSVKSYLVGGKKETLSLTWLRFLEHKNDRSKSILAHGPDGLATLSEERRLLYEEEGRVRRILFGNKGSNGTKRKPQKLNEVPAYLKKRRRVASEKGRGALTHQKDDLEREAILDDAVEEVEHDLNIGSSPDEKQNPKRKGGGRLQLARQRDHELEEAMFRISNPTELRVVLKSYESVECDYTLLLQDLQPRYVVFYDVDIAFIRSVEMYAALKPTTEPQVKSYFLIFDASAEEKTFMKALEKEKDAFERLIQHKMTMPPPLLHDTTTTQEMQQAVAQGSATSTYMDGTLPLAFDSSSTRRGQGKAVDKRKRDIAVDVREFRAALPSILHQGGMRLAPVTLTVGDFVLSNIHCVERKSISDLYGSFNSGRLSDQAQAMCKYYKEAPCLLIEFDPAKAFCLQNPNELGMDIRQDAICSKMVVLTSNNPLLRILWSKTPHETLKIFGDLKKNHSEVDVAKAVAVGRNESLEALLQGPNVGRGDNDSDDEEEDEINEAARDMLLRMPGVTLEAARRIMEQVDSLADLADLSREDLRRIAGPVAGQKLFTFFRQQHNSRE